MRSKFSVALLRYPFSSFSQKFYMCVSRSVLHCCMRKDSCIRRTLLFLVVECGCAKISVALLHQPFLTFLQKISYIRSKISIALLRHHFSAFFLEILWVRFNFCVAMLHLTGLFQLFFQNLIGELLNQCGFVASEKILYTKENQLFWW